MIKVTLVDGSIYELDNGETIHILDNGGVLIADSDSNEVAVFAKGSWAAAVRVSS